MDLAERKRINRIERQLNHLYEHLGIQRSEALPLPVPAEVYEHVRSGNRLLAIKAYCESTGADLASGKAFVEALATG